MTAPKSIADERKADRSWFFHFSEMVEGEGIALGVPSFLGLIRAASIANRAAQSGSRIANLAIPKPVGQVSINQTAEASDVWQELCAQPFFAVSGHADWTPRSIPGRIEFSDKFAH